jgi:hypothetical protein
MRRRGWMFRQEVVAKKGTKRVPVVVEGNGKASIMMMSIVCLLSAKLPPIDVLKGASDRMHESPNPSGGIRQQQPKSWRRHAHAFQQLQFWLHGTSARSSALRSSVLLMRRHHRPMLMKTMVGVQASTGVHRATVVRPRLG